MDITGGQADGQQGDKRTSGQAGGRMGWWADKRASGQADKPTSVQAGGRISGLADGQQGLPGWFCGWLSERT
ncbi:hypothetical protein GC101_28975 [Paenibacillus sp. LMG 31459]|uniref:Uncharacterized protein n=1 Tax=Paenibacillus phytohabitans TaxID=2654978 RepID=A0ABX1YPT3_9BACL|nr:hypothetical protein [Paenibacillus phytohabitans]NOU82901.1 hypothetical protein [Paenibacillus phytohabitans]